ncbi:hypothetical protein AAE478_004938 [Parahypoxylon ruwenzoriense]
MDKPAGSRRQSLSSTPSWAAVAGGQDTLVTKNAGGDMDTGTTMKTFRTRTKRATITSTFSRNAPTPDNGQPASVLQTPVPNGNAGSIAHPNGTQSRKGSFTEPMTPVTPNTIATAGSPGANNATPGPRSSGTFRSLLRDRIQAADKPTTTADPARSATPNADEKANEALEAELVSVKAAFSIMQDDLDRRNNDLVQAKAALALKDSEIQEKQREIAMLEEQLARVASDKDELSSKDKLISNLQYEVADLRDALHTGVINIGRLYGPSAPQAFTRIAQQSINNDTDGDLDARNGNRLDTPQQAIGPLDKHVVSEGKELTEPPEDGGKPQAQNGWESSRGSIEESIPGGSQGGEKAQDIVHTPTYSSSPDTPKDNHADSDKSITEGSADLHLCGNDTPKDEKTEGSENGKYSLKSEEALDLNDRNVPVGNTLPEEIADALLRTISIRNQNAIRNGLPGLPSRGIIATSPLSAFSPLGVAHHPSSSNVTDVDTKPYSVEAAKKSLDRKIKKREDARNASAANKQSNVPDTLDKDDSIQPLARSTNGNSFTVTRLSQPKDNLPAGVKNNEGGGKQAEGGEGWVNVKGKEKAKPKPSPKTKEPPSKTQTRKNQKKQSKPGTIIGFNSGFSQPPSDKQKVTQSADAEGNGEVKTSSEPPKNDSRNASGGDTVGA